MASLVSPSGFAGVTRPVGLNAYMQEQDKQSLANALAMAQIQRAQTSGMGTPPAVLKIADELRDARAKGDTQRVNDLIMVGKMMDKGFMEMPTAPMIPQGAMPPSRDMSPSEARNMPMTAEQAMQINDLYGEPAQPVELFPMQAPPAVGVRPGYNEALAQREAATKRAGKQAEKNVELDMNPLIEKSTKREGEIGKSEGENIVEYKNFSAAVPALEQTVNKLYLTADRATYTKTGQLVNMFQRETGFDPGDDASARVYYENLVRDEILPILRDTFGAAFTVKEGEWLLATLGDPNYSPAEKKAALQARVDSWKNLINTRARKAGVEPPKGAFSSFPPAQSLQQKGETAFNARKRLKGAGYSDQQIEQYIKAKGF